MILGIPTYVHGRQKIEQFNIWFELFWTGQFAGNNYQSRLVLSY